MRDLIEDISVMMRRSRSPHGWRASRISAVCAVAQLMCFAGCARTPVPSSLSPGGNPLPDPLAARLGVKPASERLLSEALQIAKAEYPIGTHLAVYPGALAQWVTARAILSTNRGVEHERPLLIEFAVFRNKNTHGYALDVVALNMNRETEAIVLWFRAESSTFEVVYKLKREEKDTSYLYITALDLALKSLRELAAIAGTKDGGRRVIEVLLRSPVWPLRDVIPFPSDPHLKLFGAVRDRSGKLSDFVPLFHFPGAEFPGCSSSTQIGRGRRAETDGE
jgi:hypothetical protein